MLSTLWKVAKQEENAETDLTNWVKLVTLGHTYVSSGSLLQ